MLEWRRVQIVGLHVGGGQVAKMCGSQKLQIVICRILEVGCCGGSSCQDPLWLADVTRSITINTVTITNVTRSFIFTHFKWFDLLLSLWSTSSPSPLSLSPLVQWSLLGDCFVAYLSSWNAAIKVEFLSSTIERGAVWLGRTNCYLKHITPCRNFIRQTAMKN